MSSCTYSKNSLVAVENEYPIEAIGLQGGKFIIDEVSEFFIFFFTQT